MPCRLFGRPLLLLPYGRLLLPLWWPYGSSWIFLVTYLPCNMPLHSFSLFCVIYYSFSLFCVVYGIYYCIHILWYEYCSIICLQLVKTRMLCLDEIKWHKSPFPSLQLNQSIKMLLHENVSYTF